MPQVGVQVHRSRGQVRMPQLSLEVIQRHSSVQGSDRMSMPQGMRRYRIQGPSVFVVTIYPLNPGLFGCLVNDLPNPPNGDMPTTLAWKEPPRSSRQARDPRIELWQGTGRHHHRPVLPGLRPGGLEVDQAFLEVGVCCL